jgi:hypothetical protein
VKYWFKGTLTSFNDDTFITDLVKFCNFCIEFFHVLSYKLIGLFEYKDIKVDLAKTVYNVVQRKYRRGMWYSFQ